MLLIKKMLNHLKSFFVLVSIYVVCIVAIGISKELQSFLVFLPEIRLPFENLTNLNRYGLEGIARNVEFKTSDGNLLRGWHLFDAISDNHGSSILTDHQLATCERIIVYCHGNAFTRGFPNRIRKIRKLSREFNAHVLIFDYSGFGDSDGRPSEAVTVNDAMAVLKYLNETVIRHNPTSSGWYSHHSSSPPPQLYFYGHSLGSGISTALLHHLTTSGIFGSNNPVSGLILDSPFTSVPDVVADHLLVKFFKPIREYLRNIMHIRFPSLERIPSLNIPILIMHGARDGTIPVEHGRRLYEAAVNSRTGACDSSDLTCASKIVRYWEVPGAGHNSVASSEGWTETIKQFMKDAEGHV